MGEDAISVLNHLVEVCRNGQHGFREAASSVRDQHLATIFLELAEQREQFAAQLRYHVSRLGHRPQGHGTIAGVLHRRWMEMRSTISARRDHVVIAECERGEEFAQKAYTNALEGHLPDDLRTVVDEQAAQLRAAHDLIRSLEVKLRQEPCY